MTKTGHLALIFLAFLILTIYLDISYGQPLDLVKIQKIVTKPALYDSKYSGLAEPDEEKVLEILKLDVYESFGVKRRSDLQEKIYEQSGEYAALKDSLVHIREAFLLEWQYARLELENDYDVKRRLFVLQESENLGYKPIPPRALGTYSFTHLPFADVRSLAGTYYNVKGSKCVQMVFYCDEKTALEIENNRKDVDVLIFFRVAGTYYKAYRFYVATGYGADAWNEIKQEVISTQDVQLAVVSKDRSRLFFIKSYAK